MAKLLREDEGEPEGAPAAGAGPGETPAGPRAPSGRAALYGNAIFVWINQAGTGLAGFLFWALAARLYDTNEVGLGSAAFSILTLLCMVSTLGLGLALIRYYPEAGAAGPRLMNAVFTWNAVAGVVAAALFLAAVPVAVPKLDFLFDEVFYAPLFVVFVVAGTLSIVQTQAFISVRKGQFIMVQVLFIQLTRLALAVVMAGAFGIVASGGLGYLLGGSIGSLLLTRAVPGFRPRLLFDRSALMKLLPFSMANYVANFLVLAPALLLPALVVGLLGEDEAAFFYVAWFVGYLPMSFATSLGTALFAEGSYDPAALRALSRRALMGGLRIAVVSAVLLLLLANVILLAFGDKYADEGATLLRIMAVAGLPAAAVNVYLGALRVMKRNWELVVIHSLIAAVTVVLSVALLPTVGVEGAGIAHLSGQLLGLGIVVWRLMSTVDGSVRERVRGLFASFARTQA